MFNSLRQLRKINRSKLSEDEWYDEDSNGRGIIDVGAENYDDVFSYYDLDGEGVLDKEFDEFLEAKADAIPMKQELALRKPDAQDPYPCRYSSEQAQCSCRSRRC